MNAISPRGTRVTSKTRVNSRKISEDRFSNFQPIFEKGLLKEKPSGVENFLGSIRSLNRRKIRRTARPNKARRSEPYDETVANQEPWLL